MKGHFYRPTNADERWSSAEIKTIGQMYQVELIIDGIADRKLPGIEESHAKYADADRQKARQWIALCYLGQRPTQDFEKCSGISPKIILSIPPAPGWSGQWTIEELWSYVVTKLVGYEIKEWQPGLWQAWSSE